ncbi:MAG: DinB family protein [Gemmatimonadaceae bacterium]
MSAVRTMKPEAGEFLPYYGRYIDLVAPGDILTTLAQQMSDTQALINSLPSSVGTYRYAPDKWSVNEMIGHLMDSERIFVARALRFARNDLTALPGFEQDDYVRNATFDDYVLAELASELESLRRSTVLFFTHLSEDAWMRRGTANGAEVTVRALAYIVAGHELHHREMLQTRYL